MQWHAAPTNPFPNYKQKPKGNAESEFGQRGTARRLSTKCGVPKLVKKSMKSWAILCSTINNIYCIGSRERYYLSHSAYITSQSVCVESKDLTRRRLQGIAGELPHFFLSML